MKEEYEKYLKYIGGVRFWIIVMGVIIALTALKEARQIVNMILLAMLLTSISLAPIAWMKKKGVNSTIAILIVIIAILASVGLMGLVIGSSANSFIQRLPFYQEKFSEVWSGLTDWLAIYGLDPADEINPGRILPIAGSFFASFGNVVGESVIVFIFFIFMIFEAETFDKKVKFISPDSSDRTQISAKKLRKYFGIKTLTSLATGISITIALFIIGVDFPVLWGFLAFILNFLSVASLKISFGLVLSMPLQ